MVMEFWALLLGGVYFLEKVPAKVELVKQLWAYILFYPEWKNYLKEADDKVNFLERKQEKLNCLEEDTKEKLKDAELKSGKKRKREVDTWLRNVVMKRKEVEDIKQQHAKRKYFLQPWLGNRIDRNLEEMQQLCEQGQFSEGLFLDVIPTYGEQFVTGPLVGQISNLETIGQWLKCLQVSRIGVYGKKGVGKTAILTHIHNELIQSKTFDCVFWVSAPEKCTTHKLQDVIARQFGLSLSDEEDTKIRAAKLHKAMTQRKKCVIILDGIGTPFKNEDGIPTQLDDKSKLILCTESLRNCQRMQCQTSLEIKPLSNDDAMTLFKKKVSSSEPLEPKIEEIMDQIVQHCQGLPQKIVEQAEILKGVDDITEWRNALAEMTESRNESSD
ncbi:probable disease resistance protein At1g52660 [Humulus lupulus]|uniref:probable disease resistance protein At1g52660 n=1 Tax=Humulus lupulus TaxID=3486 RepID=UPI002B4099E7|nr:probable disease resistance protein At1g52660 [Humulus lupulus]